ncbi:hypothetical protein F975_02350 [Acinetobacter sp. ANC 3789]|nr:hypothetical protein F975_02350 [Acinetobacter sp. ANC 3789]
MKLNISFTVSIRLISIKIIIYFFIRFSYKKHLKK